MLASNTFLVLGALYHKVLVRDKGREQTKPNIDILVRILLLISFFPFIVSEHVLIFFLGFAFIVACTSFVFYLGSLLRDHARVLLFISFS